MATMKEINAKLPTAEVVAGRVQVYYAPEGKHYTLGDYVGDDAVVLTAEGQALLDSIIVAEPTAPRRARKPAEPVVETPAADAETGDA